MYYNIIILWDHRRICGPSLTESRYAAHIFICVSIFKRISTLGLRNWSLWNITRQEMYV